jgi:voltage-gated potassium channel Kch
MAKSRGPPKVHSHLLLTLLSLQAMVVLQSLPKTDAFQISSFPPPVNRRNHLQQGQRAVKDDFTLYEQNPDDSTISTETQQSNDDALANGEAEDPSLLEFGQKLQEELLAYCVVNWDDISTPYVSPMDSDSTFIDYTDDGACLPAGPVGQFKETLANFFVEPFVEVVIAGAVLLNSLLVALSTLDSLLPYTEMIQTGEFFVSFLFCFDFCGRWFSSSRDPGRHILDPQFALDVLVVIIPLVVTLTPASFWTDMFLPSGLTNTSGLFNLELLRVLRLRRVLQDLPTFERFTERALGVMGTRTVTKVQEWQLQLSRVLLSLFTIVSVSTGLIYTAEHAVNPAINNYFDALYFGLTTLTTVGFGDVYPVTWQGKLVVCGTILVGVAVIPAQAAALVEALLEREDMKKKSRRLAQTSTSTKSSDEGKVLALDTAKACSRCGASFHWTNAQFCYSCGEVL